MNQPQPITKSLLADAYGVPYKVFASWMKKAKFYQEFPEAKRTNILTPKQVNFLYEKLDRPEDTTEKTPNNPN
jgi:hypothetical protein